MVARVQQPGSGLILVFSRRGEQPENILCVDGDTAADHALHAIAKNRPLIAGDVLFIRRDVEVGTMWPDDQFPEPDGGV